MRTRTRLARACLSVEYRFSRRWASAWNVSPASIFLERLYECYPPDREQVSRPFCAETAQQLPRSGLRHAEQVFDIPPRERLPLERFELRQRVRDREQPLRLGRHFGPILSNSPVFRASVFVFLSLRASRLPLHVSRRSFTWPSGRFRARPAAFRRWLAPCLATSLFRIRARTDCLPVLPGSLLPLLYQGVKRFSPHWLRSGSLVALLSLSLSLRLERAMVATRLGREFGDQVLRLEATHRGRLSGLFTDLRTILAIQTDRKSVDRLGEYILRRPVRVASLLAEHPDPVLLTALAGDRAMRNLSGLDATGTDGENVPHASTLESLAARAARDHLRLCQTDPTVARQREATWAANRAAVRSSFLRESVDAMESTFGSACHVILDRAEGRRPLVVPPGEWQAQGVMAAVAAELPRAYRQMCDGVPMQASMPARWAPRGGDRHRGWDRARVRFIAKGGIGRAEQLARRSLLRVGVSTVAMRYRLATALDAGPAATQQFLQRAASNPRRAAALLRMNMDPMVVASALGPKAMEAVMSGRPVPGETNLHRLCDALVRADRARVEELRRSDNPQAELLAHRRDQDFGAAAGAYVNRQWHGAADRDSPLGSDVLGLSDNPEAFYQLWQQRRTGDPAARELPAAIQNRMQEVRNGPGGSRPGHLGARLRRLPAPSGFVRASARRPPGPVPTMRTVFGFLRVPMILPGSFRSVTVRLPIVSRLGSWFVATSRMSIRLRPTIRMSSAVVTARPSLSS